MANVLLDVVALCLVFVGALNWGLVVFNQNLVKSIDKVLNNLFGTKLPIENGVYVAVAVAAVYLVFARSEWLSDAVAQRL
jgi:uncharacterized membrane protein YuzA (DUF378 family)